MRSNVREMKSSREDAGLPTKDETSEKIVLSVFLHSGFLVGQNCLISVLTHLVNPQNNQLNAEPKIKIKIVIFFSLISVSSFKGNP